MGEASGMEGGIGGLTWRSDICCVRGFYRKIFIGGLSYETTDGTPVLLVYREHRRECNAVVVFVLFWTFVEKLRSYFAAYGSVTDAVVMKDPISRRSRGFGFITYADPGCVDRALAQPNHILDSRRVSVPLVRIFIFSSDLDASTLTVLHSFRMCDRLKQNERCPVPKALATSAAAAAATARRAEE